MTEKKIPIAKPFLNEKEKEMILEPLQTGWLVQGPYVRKFEDQIASFCNVDHAIATTSCTTALHLALISSGIGTGMSVLVPSFTYVATINSILYTGAEPVFCDIDISTFNIDIDEMLFQAGRSTSKVKAVIPVHLFGLMAPMKELMEQSRKFGWIMIEDAACALGSKIDRLGPGKFGTSGCLSFHPRKSITTGEGGMILTDSESVATMCRSLRDHGAELSDLQRHQSKKGFHLPDFKMLGYNYRMTDFQGAMGVAQMEKIDDILSLRDILAKRYCELLKDVSWITLPFTPEGYTHAWQSYVCKIDVQALGWTVEQGTYYRDWLMAKLEEEGIATRQGTHAVHTLSFHRSRYGFKNEDFPNSYAADRLSLAIPLYAGLSNDDQNLVASCLRHYGPECPEFEMERSR